MARNQRQRRPLQDEGRQEKQNVRERAQGHRRQRDRIEENRDRRERQRDRRRARRQQVDSVRSPKEDLRTERWESRLMPVEDSFLARPVGQPAALPVVIGSRNDRTSGFSTSAGGAYDTIIFDTNRFDTSRNGYPDIYNASTGLWRVPSGLSGVWWMSMNALADSTGTGWIFQWYLNAATVLTYYHFVGDGSNGRSVAMQTVRYLYEGDEVICRVNTGVAATISGGEGQTNASMIFLGK